MSFSTFGEIMLRLSPTGQADRIHTTHLFAADYAGSESNVATSLACLGNKVQFISKLPENSLGDAAIQTLNKFGVSTHSVVRGGQRIGTYFIELGSSIRPSRVVYDRAGSAMSDIKKNEFNWENLFVGQKWVHVSGITPALSEQCAAETILAVKTARSSGVKVSFDLNYRRSLWDSAKRARTIFDQILEHTDLVFGNTGVFEDVYDLKFTGTTSIDRTTDALRKVRQLFGVARTAFTVREHISASFNRLSGAFIAEGEPLVSQNYDVEIKDRFGTGDAFAAGFLHAIDKGLGGQKSLEFATAAFALKHTLMGDVNSSTEKEITSICEGNISGHVIR